MELRKSMADLLPALKGEAFSCNQLKSKESFLFSVYTQKRCWIYSNDIDPKNHDSLTDGSFLLKRSSFYSGNKSVQRRQRKERYT